MWVAHLRYAMIYQEVLHCHGRMTMGIIMQNILPFSQNCRIILEMCFSNLINICTQNSMFTLFPSGTIFFWITHVYKRKWSTSFWSNFSSNFFCTLVSTLFFTSGFDTMFEDGTEIPKTCLSTSAIKILWNGMINLDKSSQVVILCLCKRLCRIHFVQIFLTPKLSWKMWKIISHLTCRWSYTNWRVSWQFWPTVHECLLLFPDF